MSENYQNLIQATYRYYYEDGFVEIAVGALFAGFGMLLLAVSEMSGGPLFALSLAVGLPLLVIGGARLVERFVSTSKEKITHQRTGAIKYRKDQRSPVQRKSMWIGLIGLFLLIMVVPSAAEHMSLAEGLLFAIVLGSIGRAYGIHRFFLTAAMAAIIGIIAALLTSTDILGSAVTFSGIGAVLIISGAITFKGYLGRSRRTAGADHE